VVFWSVASFQYRFKEYNTKGNNMNNTLSLKPYRRGTSLNSTKWYMASLTTNLAEKKDTDGAFCLVEANLANEPPPHMHSREDELFYVLEGEFDVYVGEEGFKVAKGDCVFLPRRVPHAFAIRSPQIRLLTLFTPAGLEDACRSASLAAKNLEHCRPGTLPMRNLCEV
jgi:mannose-6-phosphate isomerase-like protein (cupin superfamily)